MSNFKLLQLKIALGNKQSNIECKKKVTCTLNVKRKLHFTLFVIALYSLRINLDFDV